MSNRYIFVVAAWLSCVSMPLLAQTTPPTPIATSDTSFADSGHLFLLLIAICLLLPIYILGRILVMSARMYYEKESKSTHSNTLFWLGWATLAWVLPQTLQAQTAVVETTAQAADGNTNWLYVVLLSAILLELLLIAFLSLRVRQFLKGTSKVAKPSVAARPSLQARFMRWWAKVNNFRSIEEEADIDTGHSYDGIRELDNVTPSWFTFAFAMSILIAIVYLWRYHVAESAPLQLEEFRMEMAAAEEAKAEYLKKQANNVDENTVKLLGEADIAAGQKIFVAQCAACHSENGASKPGGVGPNLTDNHWLHGDKMPDIFKTIKYGYPDKGMKSWKDDFSPHQIAQLSSFVHSIAGSNLSGGKEPQGNIATAAATPADSTAAPADTIAQKH
jgi:cytochrome c oxidase cbb3-type subunit 3